jgi:WhiB family redox-sensing transcriptional regulator
MTARRNGNGTYRLKLIGWGPIAEWESRANCQDAPLEWFFGDRDDGRDKHSARRTAEQTAKAKALCESCPVLDACREWGIVSGLPYGYVGGMTEAARERERLARGLPIRHTITGGTGHQVRSPAKVHNGSLLATAPDLSVRIGRWSSGS